MTGRPRDPNKDRAFQGPPAHVAAALNARKAADEAEAAAQEAERLAQVITRKTVIVNAAPKPRGTARKFTPQLQKRYLELVRKTGMPVKCAEAVGISTWTVNATRRADPEFDAACKAARADATAPIVEAMWDLALSGSFAAQKYLLENMAPEDWKDPKNIKVEVSGQIESVEPADRTAQIERIRRLEERLAERLALRAAGDEIEAELEDAEVVEDEDERTAPQIEGADWVDQLPDEAPNLRRAGERRSPQIEGADG